MALSAIAPEVLTLEETADYLRLSTELVEREANQGRIPGRRIDNNWRFLKSSLMDWLNSQDSRSMLLQQAGALADDPSLVDLRDDIYAQRGRPEIESEVGPGIR